jgi:hypothetical protein
MALLTRAEKKLADAFQRMIGMLKELGLGDIYNK